MARNRTTLGLTTVLILLMGAVASAQGLRDMQIFATVDQSRYGGGYRPSEGYFFAFDGLVWSMSPPDGTDVGREGLTRNVVFVPDGGYDTATLVYPLPTTVESSSLHTGAFEAEWTGGQRYDFGYITGHHGWYFSAFRLQDVNQDIYGSDASVVFEDAPIGLPIPALDPSGAADNITTRLQGYVDDGLTTYANLPATFDALTVRNEVHTWGAEWNYIYRAHPGHHGGIFEWMLGVRYLEFEELFDVFGEQPGDDDAAAADPVAPTYLDESFWTTTADNHIIGGQLGLRWFRRQNRWTWEVQGRFFAGYNAQSINQRAVLGSNLALLQTSPTTPGVPVKLTSTIRTESEYNTEEWSPNGELRIILKYQLARSITGRVGWTGMWLNGIARPSNMVDYSLRSDGSVFGILQQNNTQDVFINGLTFGVDVNW